MVKTVRFSAFSFIILALFIGPFSVSAAKLGVATPASTASDTSSTSSKKVSKVQYVQLFGKLKELIIEPKRLDTQTDRVQQSGSFSKFVLEGQGGQRTLLVDDPRLFVMTNQAVRVTGSIIPSGELSITEVIPLNTVQTTTDSSPTPTVGSRKVLVLLSNFMNDLSQPYSSDDVRDAVYNSPDSPQNFFKEASLYRFQLTGITRPDIDVAEWRMLPMTNQSCDAHMFTDWTTARNDLARQQGYEPNNYQTVIYMFPAISDCANSVSASVGTIGGSSRVETIYFSLGAVPNASTLVHEIGHNLGLRHASGYECTGTAIPASCSFRDYGDPGDFMTGDYRLPNNYHRSQLGWMWRPALDITISGDYSLAAPTSFLPLPQLLRIPLKDASGNLTGTSIWLETRRQYLFDDFSLVQYQNFTKGISIRYGSDDLGNVLSRSILVDTTPGSFLGAIDAPLMQGRTFTDDTAGLSITVTRGNTMAAGARVHIQLSR